MLTRKNRTFITALRRIRVLILSIALLHLAARAIYAKDSRPYWTYFLEFSPSATGAGTYLFLHLIAGLFLFGMGMLVVFMFAIIHWAIFGSDAKENSFTSEAVASSKELPSNSPHHASATG